MPRICLIFYLGVELLRKAGCENDKHHSKCREKRQQPDAVYLFPGDDVSPRNIPSSKYSLINLGGQCYEYHYVVR